MDEKIKLENIICNIYSKIKDDNKNIQNGLMDENYKRGFRDAVRFLAVIIKEESDINPIL